MLYEAPKAPLSQTVLRSLEDLVGLPSGVRQNYLIAEAAGVREIRVFGSQYSHFLALKPDERLVCAGEICYLRESLMESTAGLYITGNPRNPRLRFLPNDGTCWVDNGSSWWFPQPAPLAKTHGIDEGFRIFHEIIGPSRSIAAVNYAALDRVVEGQGLKGVRTVATLD